MRENQNAQHYTKSADIKITQDEYVVGCEISKRLEGCSYYQIFGRGDCRVMSRVDVQKAVVGLLSKGLITRKNSSLDYTWKLSGSLRQYRDDHDC